MVGVYSIHELWSLCHVIDVKSLGKADAAYALSGMITYIIKKQGETILNNV